MPKSPSKSPILPPEAWETVFGSLALKDIKSVRLVCQTFSGVVARFLFQPYVFRCDRKDIEKFGLIAEHDDMIAGIKNIGFEIGTMDIYHMSKRLGSIYMRDYNNSLSALPFGNKNKDELLLSQKCAATEYAQWNSRWHDANQQYETHYLRPLFAKLKTLNSIEISRKSTTFKNEMLLDAWALGSRNANFNIAANELIIILEVLAACPHLTLRSLTHDQLPTLFFFRRPQDLRELIAPLKTLEKLHVSFDATKAPHVKFWQGLRVLLTSLPNLKDLRFGFEPLHDGMYQQSTWINAAKPEDYYVPFQKLLGDHTLSKLCRLRLDGMLMCETGLTAFLMRHKTTLRSLELYRPALWEGRFKSLLTDAKLAAAAKNVFRAHRAAVDAGYLDFSESGYIRYKLGTDLDITDQVDTIGDNGDSWYYDSIYFSASDWRTIDKGLTSLPRAFGPLVMNRTMFQTAVQEVSYNETTDKVTVGYRSGNPFDMTPSTLEFDYVITAVPFTRVRLWRLPAYSSLLSRAIKTLNYQPSCKIALHYKTRFWEHLDKPILGGCGSVDIPGIGSICYPSYKINSTGPGVLLATYQSGDLARSVAALSDIDHVALVQRAIIETHGPIAEEQFTGFYDRHCWEHDPFEMGAWCGPLAGQQRLYLPAYFKTEMKTVFVGEHTSYTHAWIWSALESAVRGTTQLLLDMGLVDEAKEITGTWMARWMEM